MKSLLNTYNIMLRVYNVERQNYINNQSFVEKYGKLYWILNSDNISLDVSYLIAWDGLQGILSNNENNINNNNFDGKLFSIINKTYSNI